MCGITVAFLISSGITGELVNTMELHFDVCCHALILLRIAVVEDGLQDDVSSLTKRP